MSFGIGTSISQVCKYCKSAVVRTDRDFKLLGKVADLPAMPAPIAVGDQGNIAGKPMMVLGRVQLRGPQDAEFVWDEFYVAYQGSWGWLAYAQGNWYATAEAPLQGDIRSWDVYNIEQDVPLGQLGVFRVKECKRAEIVTAEGELPFVITPGQARFYIDLVAVNNGFATLDYGDGSEPPRLFAGQQLPDAAVEIKQLGERPVTEINTDQIKCPNCGGTIQANAPKRSERVGCPYCGAVSDIALQRVVQMQDAARSAVEIPLGSRGGLNGHDWVVCGYCERSTNFEGERFSWQEYLLWGPGFGFRWLVKDESTWMWVDPINTAELDLRAMPNQVGYQGRSFSLRNTQMARCDYVLGEFFWKVKIGETVENHDFINGSDVVASEFTGDEVNWSLCVPIPWSVIATAFNLPLDGPGSKFTNAEADYSYAGGTDNSKTNWQTILTVVGVIALIILCCVCNAMDDDDDSGGFFFWSGGSRGGK